MGSAAGRPGRHPVETPLIFAKRIGLISGDRISNALGWEGVGYSDLVDLAYVAYWDNRPDPRTPPHREAA